MVSSRLPRGAGMCWNFWTLIRSRDTYRVTRIFQSLEQMDMVFYHVIYRCQRIQIQVIPYFIVHMSVNFAPHYQHFLNFIRVLTSFAIVLEFLIGFRNSSGLYMHKKCDFRNAKLTSRISTLSGKQIFFLSSGKI